MGYLSRAGWTVTADNDLGTGFTPDKAIDANNATFWHSDNTSFPHYLSIDLGSAQASQLLRYRPRQDGGILRCPTSVEVYASTDGVTWGSAISSLTWTANTKDHWIDYPRQNCRYIRLKIISGSNDNYSACSELYLYDSGYPEFAPHDLTGSGSHSPFVASASSEFSGNEAFHAFDGLIGFGSWWIGTGGAADWLKLDTGASAILFSYHIQNHEYGSGELTRAPKTWTLEASNDGSSWTTVDTVASETGWDIGERRVYDCDTTTTAYRYFRLNITANNTDATYTNVGELYLYGSLSSPSAAIPVIANHLRQQGIM